MSNVILLKHALDVYHAMILANGIEHAGGKVVSIVSNPDESGTPLVIYFRYDTEVVGETEFMRRFNLFMDQQTEEMELEDE